MHHADLGRFSVRELAAAARLAEDLGLDPANAAMQWLKNAARPLLSRASKSEALALGV